MDALKLENSIDINTIVWFQSLREDEVGPSNRMVEDLEGLKVKGGFPVERIIVHNRQEAFDAFANLVERADAGLRAIIHFDCHGSKSDGLLLQNSGEFLSWGELADALRPINVAAKNNVCCIFGVCFGLHFSFELRLLKPSPYFLTIAPEQEINVGVLEDHTVKFYNRLNETENITQAYSEIFEPDLHLFHCQAVFAQALAIYVHQYCRGKRGAARREKLLTEILAKRGVSKPTQAELKSTREEIKELVKPSQECCQSNANSSPLGIARPTRAADQAKRFCHSAKAAERFAL
jgi:hypothetical protein